MREIKFRGKRVFDGNWVYGYYFGGFNWADFIIEDAGFEHRVQVIPESVGQYTGLKDKNGVDIYEGDIIAISSRGFDFDCQVTYDKQLIPVGEKSKGWEHMLYSPYWEECVIIGNIHEQK